jgi:hypothetical protein
MQRPGRDVNWIVRDGGIYLSFDPLGVDFIRMVEARVTWKGAVYIECRFLSDGWMRPGSHGKGLCTLNVGFFQMDE